jgi:hypothetical protein
VDTRNFFFESAIAIPQLEGSTSAIAIPQLFKEMLFRICNSAIPQSQFFLMSATSSQQLESFISTIFRNIFGHGIWSIHEKNGGKKSCETVP